MKKSLITLLSLLLATAMFFSACSTNNESSAVSGIDKKTETTTEETTSADFDNLESNTDKIVFDSIVVNKKEADKLEVYLFSETLVNHAQYGYLKPMLALEINTTSDALPIDTLDILAGNIENTITAGYFDMETMSYRGSCYHYVDPVALQAGVIDRYFTWRLNKGKLAIDAQGNILTAGNFYNGKHFTMRYNRPTTALDNVVAEQNQVTKYVQNGQLIIRKNDVEYDVLGNQR